VPESPRIHIVGTSCSGKSTFGRELSLRLSIPFVELDALHWGPNWQEAETEVFQARVAAAIEPDSWIVDGSYGRKIGTAVSERRNIVIWIDLSLPRILFRFLKRSLKRAWSKELLWGGCRETLRNSLFQRDSLLFWILKHHKPARDRYFELLESPPAGVQVIRLRSPKEVRQFLENSLSHKRSKRDLPNPLKPTPEET
jgi:adenylate kinase family enzyme